MYIRSGLPGTLSPGYTAVLARFNPCLDAINRWRYRRNRLLTGRDGPRGQLRRAPGKPCHYRPGSTQSRTVACLPLRQRSRRRSGRAGVLFPINLQRTSSERKPDGLPLGVCQSVYLNRYVRVEGHGRRNQFRQRGRVGVDMSASRDVNRYGASKAPSPEAATSRRASTFAVSLKSAPVSTASVPEATSYINTFVVASRLKSPVCRRLNSRSP